MRVRWLLALSLTLVSVNATAGSGDLKYFGGRVISNVKIVEIAWGASVDATYMTQLRGFYTAIVKSPFVDWMTEYDTIGLVGFADLQPGSNQHIGRGSFIGNVVITPTNQSTTLNDQDIQTELVAQLAALKLPQPDVDANGNVDSLYMIDFPAGTSITLVGLQSCSSFGAYHGTITFQGSSVPYGVHPNCGYSFDTSTLVHSHELAEAMTDTEVGIVEYNTTNPNGRPLAWSTIAPTAWQSEEAADICAGTSDKVAGYRVQKIWSNYAQACVSQIPICDGALVPPACRPCNGFDSGSACTNACATSGAKAGECVTCTSKYAIACSGATPACDDATYTCVACVTNADCTNASTPICDEASHTCHACTTDGECGPNVCDVPSGKCVACNTDAQCKPDEQCTAHACAPKVVADAGAEVGDEESSGGAGCSCNTKGSRSPRDVLAFVMAGLALTACRKKRLE